MSKFLFLLVGVVILSKTNGTLITSKPSLTPKESYEEFSTDDWSELDAISPYSESFHFPEKRANRDVLMRRSTLDKNFMRFGRSGFFPGERCCRQKDLVGFAETYSSGNSPTGTKTDSNFMRFGRGDNNNFMRFGKKNGEDFMRLGRPDNDKGNFMRFGRGGSDNFMRFGRSDKDKGNFMRFGRDDKNNFMRFGRGGDDNFIRFGRGDEFFQTEENFQRPTKNDNFMRFDRNPINFIRYGQSNGKDGFIRFGKRNKTNSRFDLDSDEDLDNEDNIKSNLTSRRKRMISEGATLHERITRDPELMEVGKEEVKRSPIGENLTKPNLLQFISLINKNNPNWEHKNSNSFFPPGQQNPVLKPSAEIYKRKQNGNGFIRFG